MGNRANYVIVKRGKATVYYDHWGALACLLSLDDGPAGVERCARRETETDELMEWAWAEGGFLLDHDRRHCIAFGYLDVDLDELPSEVVESVAAFDEAVRRGPEALFAHVAPRWRGWTLEWNNAGTDAFAKHLAKWKVQSIDLPPRVEVQDVAPPYVVTIAAASARTRVNARNRTPRRSKRTASRASKRAVSPPSKLAEARPSSPNRNPRSRTRPRR